MIANAVDPDQMEETDPETLEEFENEVPDETMSVEEEPVVLGKKGIKLNDVGKMTNVGKSKKSLATKKVSESKPSKIAPNAKQLKGKMVVEEENDEEEIHDEEENDEDEIEEASDFIPTKKIVATPTPMPTPTPTSTSTPSAPHAPTLQSNQTQTPSQPPINTSTSTPTTSLNSVDLLLQSAKQGRLYVFDEHSLKRLAQTLSDLLDHQKSSEQLIQILEGKVLEQKNSEVIEKIAKVKSGKSSEGTTSHKGEFIDHHRIL